MMPSTKYDTPFFVWFFLFIVWVIYQITVIALKLTGVIAWVWGLVLAPAIFLGVVFSLFAIYILWSVYR